MGLVRKFQQAVHHEGFREKLTEMATEFFVEASVLVAVLGILERAIQPKELGLDRSDSHIFGWSALCLVFGFVLFGMGCIIQLKKYSTATEDIAERDARQGQED